MLALLLVALSLGMSNFAASIAIGLSGVDARLRLRIAVSFGLFEAGMPILGLLIGRQGASALGSHADLIAGCLVITTGIYSLLNPLHSEQQPPSASQPIGRLLTTGFALSIDLEEHVADSQGHALAMGDDDLDLVHVGIIPS